MVNSITPRKIIGTIVLAAILLLGVFGTAKAAQAIFISQGRTLTFDAVVGFVGRNDFSAYTTSSSPVTVDVNRRTIFSDHDSLRSMMPGDAVKIIATRSGRNLVGNFIDVEGTGSGYGTVGQPVVISNATVQFKTGTSFTVTTNGVSVLFNVNSSTRFFNTSFMQLRRGQRVTIIGVDTGSSSTGFIAQEVFR